MLMIGGEFDLSAGVIVTTAGLFNAMFCYQLGLNLWVGAVVSPGLLPGHRLPQRLPGDEDRHPQLPDHPGHVLRPAGRQPRRHQARHRLGVDARTSTRWTATTRSSWIFASQLPDRLGARSASPSSGGSLFVALAAWILLRTKIGNWIYAVGGNAGQRPRRRCPGAQGQDRPVHDGVASSAGSPACTRSTTSTRIQAGNGVGNEFLYIIAAVVGGTLLTGGYGNAIGVAIGSFIFGMTSLCIVYAGWDPNWFRPSSA